MTQAGFQKLERCRISGSDSLVSILDLGKQDLTGVFPGKKDESVTRGPLELVWCPQSRLVQLAHTYQSCEMYGDNYGYRSGLNQSMVDHLTKKARYLERLIDLESGDVVVDIGSNDATTLKSYETKGLLRIGIDPTGLKFKEYYPNDINLVPEFFSLSAIRKITSKHAKLITSIAMFYDLDDPVMFAKEISEALSPDGIWHFEQSYLPSMLRLCSYDTICHEHLEYYSLDTVKYILDKAGMKIIDVQMNLVNGGSFAVTAAKKDSRWRTNSTIVNWLLMQEILMGLDTIKPYRDFEERVYRHRTGITRLLSMLVNDGKKILGYGASTKGNVVLQACAITDQYISAIAEINPEKYGRFTPGTHIPIVSEEEAREMQPDYLLVLPWHFKDNIIRREQEFLKRGGRMIFPFPEIEII